MDYQNKLRDIGIELSKSGRQTCPQCSEQRKSKTEKCLSVKYADDGVLYNCHHCGFQGKVFYRDKDEYKKVFFKPMQPKLS